MRANNGSICVYSTIIKDTFEIYSCGKTDPYGTSVLLNANDITALITRLQEALKTITNKDN